MHRFFLILALILIFHPLKAVPELEFVRLNSNHGLSSEEVRNIFQDSRGYIWFLTREGLNRYDGYDFEVYKQGNAELDFTTSSFESICEDRQGRLWLGSQDKGIFIFNPEEYTLVPFDSISGGTEPSDPHIRSLLSDASGAIWIGTEYGLYRYKPEDAHLEYYNLGSPGSDTPAWCIVEDLMLDEQGNLWVATWNMGLFIFQMEKQAFLNFTEFNAVSYTAQANQIKTVFQDQLGFVWVGTWEDGLYKTRFSRGELEVLETHIFDDNNPQSISGNIIYSINQDYNSNIWVGTPYGLTIIEGAYSEKPHYKRIVYRYEAEKGLSNNEVWKIIEDRSGLMWLGTLEGGANKVHPGGRLFDSFSIPPVSSQIQSQTTQAFCMDPLGNFLIGVKSLGFGRYDLNKKDYIPYTEVWPYNQMPYAINSVNCFQVMGDELWLGTRYLGLIIFNCRNASYTTLYDIDSSFTPFEVNTIHLDKAGNAWVGSEDGLYKVERGSRDEYRVERLNGLSGNRINTIFQDRGGNIWVGAKESGITLLQDDAGSYKPVRSFLQDQNNSPSNHINVVFQDSRDQLWAGTSDQGLLIYNPDDQVFVRSDALLHSKGDAIMAMTEDKDGSIWLTTNGGIVRMYYKGNILKSDNYTVADGLQGNIFLHNALYQLNGNRVFAGGYYGFNAFYPGSIKQNNFIPPTVITGISVNNRPLYPNNPDLEGITLNHNQNNLEISFSSLSFHKSEKNVFAYKLDQVNEQWQYIDATQRHLNFSNLKAGNYRFLVKSANSSEIWNEQPAYLEFTILKPPWRTWWAISLYSLFILSLAVGLFRFLLRSERVKRAYELEKMEHARDEKLNQFKLRFFTNISHELLTPLSIMYCAIDLLKIKTRKGKEELVILERNITQLKRLLNQLLDFRKMESGHLKLKVSRGNLHALIETIVEDFRPLANKNELLLTLISNCDTQHGYFDEDKLNKVMHNLLSNAIKYTPGGGMIAVFLEIVRNEQETYARVKVSDSGAGIPEKDLHHIFDRFYRAEIDSAETGTGIGLSLSRNLVELHKGKIQVNSEPGKGTNFTLDIPIHKSAFRAEELKKNDLNRVLEGNKDIALAYTSYGNRAPAPGEIKVLLAEDNPDFRNILTSFLSKHYHVLETDNGQMAMQMAISQDPHIVISDVMMPGKTGFELCNELKNNEETKTIPVILLTALSSDTDIAEGYHSGADSYIAKPVSLPVLLSRISSLLMKRINLEPFTDSAIKKIETNGKLSNEQFIGLLKKVISENLSDAEFQVSDLHLQFGMSGSNFYRKVKDLTKLAPVEYVRKYRLNRAATLLKKEELSIGEIAYGTGFSDQSYFGACFKKQFGMTPSAYIQKARASVTL